MAVKFCSSKILFCRSILFTSFVGRCVSLLWRVPQKPALRWGGSLRRCQWQQRRPGQCVRKPGDGRSDGLSPQCPEHPAQGPGARRAEAAPQRRGLYRNAGPAGRARAAHEPNGGGRQTWRGNERKGRQG